MLQLSINTDYNISFLLLLLFPLYLHGCKGSEKKHITNLEITKPIVETDQVASLIKEKENVIVATAIQDVEWYRQSCDKREKKNGSKELIFVQILGKNPSKTLLNKLNQNIDAYKKFKAAKEGVAVFKRGLLMGYRQKKSKAEGYVISISNITLDTDTTASVSFSQLKTSLSGVDKTYQLKKNNSKWEITGCKVHSFS